MSHPLESLKIYAPNVHTGGGLVLLRELLLAWPQQVALHAWLDARSRVHLDLPPLAIVEWVRPRIASRMRAEWTLHRSCSAEDTILCFHGLPPVLSSRSRIEVFLQNVIYLGNVPLSDFEWRVRQRLRFEQLLSRWRRRQVARYWVQTPSMARALRDWCGSETADDLRIEMLPFMPTIARGPETREHAVDYDFLYVADGTPLKNHRQLVEAWVLLAEAGVRPSLALTLSPRDSKLQSWIEERSAQHGLRIHHLGTLPHAAVLALYGRVKALVYPSLGESFGLPLLEAQASSCPILASELDFVRDVCQPAQSFDPLSAVSIARAVRRFLAIPENFTQPADGAAFLKELGSVSGGRGKHPASP